MQIEPTDIDDIEEGMTITVLNASAKPVYYVTGIPGGGEVELKNGESGKPGLYRLVRDGDDGIIQYHRETISQYGKTREWHPKHRLGGLFAEDIRGEYVVREPVDG